MLDGNANSAKTVLKTLDQSSPSIGFRCVPFDTAGQIDIWDFDVIEVLLRGEDLTE
jgi:hypothetical protein